MERGTGPPGPRPGRRIVPQAIDGPAAVQPGENLHLGSTPGGPALASDRPSDASGGAGARPTAAAATGHWVDLSKDSVVDWAKLSGANGRARDKAPKGVAGSGLDAQLKRVSPLDRIRMLLERAYTEAEDGADSGNNSEGLIQEEGGGRWTEEADVDDEEGGSDDEDTAPEADDEEDEKRPGRAKGGNYDLDDEWIDDSDLVELYEARGHKLKYSGFYVHRGPLNMYTMDTAERPAKKRRASDSALVQKGRPSGAAKPKGTWKVATALTNQAKRHKAATKQPKARASSEAEKQGKQGGKMPPPPARKRKQSPTLLAGGKKTHSTKPESQPSTSNQPNEPSRCEPSSKPQPVPIVGSIAAMAVAAGACASARSIKPKPVGPRALQHAQQQSARHSIQVPVDEDSLESLPLAVMVATAPTKGMVALKEQVQGKVTSIGQNVAKQLQGGESTSGGQQKAQQAAGNCELKKLSHSQGARPSAPPSPAGGKSSGSGTPPKTSPSRSCIIAPDFPPEVQAGVARLEAVAKKVQPPSGEKKKIPAVLNDQLHSDVAVFTSYCEMGRSAAAKLVADLMRFMDPFTSKENLRKKFMSKRSTQGEETAREREKTLNRVKGKLHRAIQDRMLAAKREESGPSPSHKNEPANNEDDDFQSPQGTKPRGRSRNLPWNKKIQRLLYDAVSAHQKRRDAGDEVAESILGELLSYWPPGCVTEEAMMQNILKERRRRESAAALAEKASQSQPTAETKTVQNSQPGGENSQPGNTQGLPPRRQSTTEPEHQDGVAVRGSQDANKVNGASQIQNPVAAAPVHSPVAAIPTSGQSSQTPI